MEEYTFLLTIASIIVPVCATIIVAVYTVVSRVKAEHKPYLILEKIESLSEKIEIFLSDMGFDEVTINTFINEEAREQFKKELNTTVEVIENKQNKKVIKGNPISGEKSEIKNLITNEDKVVLIAKIFGLESKSTQSGWFIITLKLTDYTDSIMANIFTKKEEEFNYLLDNIKKENGINSKEI